MAPMHDLMNDPGPIYKGRNDGFPKEFQHGDEDQMIISGDSIDRFLKSNDSAAGSVEQSF